jgi:bifunctional aspartokinase / homoserine dehydrogenase 1
MIVLKFGGTSVADARNILKVGAIISRLNTKNKKEQIAVVVSAMTGVTDELIRISRLASTRDNIYLDLFTKLKQRHHAAISDLGLSKEKGLKEFVDQLFDGIKDTLHGVYLVRELSARTLDFISAHGELLSARIIASSFKKQKLSAGFLDARTMIKTDEQFGSALVDFTITNKNLRAHFRNTKNRIEVITGFVASTEKNETTTLGRGGSDYTAAIVGAALQASEIQIWTDVDGVMTADPRKVRKAFSIPTMTYIEAMEMSHFGAKVIHPPTIQPALEKGIPLRIKNTFNPESEGTLISTKSTSAAYLIKGVSSIDDISLLTLQGSGMVGVTGISARLFNALSASKINVVMITQGSSEHAITFAVKPADAPIAKKAIELAFFLEIKSHLIDEVRIENGMSIIAVIGENMRNTPGVSGRLFQALGKNGISVVATAQGSSELNISTVIHKPDLIKGLNALHQSFFLSDVKTLSVYLVGAGLIGKTLIKQIEKHKQFLKESRMLEISIAGIANSKKMYFNADGINLKRYAEFLEKEGEKMSMNGFVSRMQELNLPQSIFVDCTSSEDIASHYAAILNDSISIVTPNKIGNAGTYSQYKKVRENARKRNVCFLYETNVGAGLPVISTLNDLLTSGDEIISIEAVLSGTLSFIFNNFKEGKKFSSIVTQAKELGYTEPDPRDDLSGTDVARKLLILARETGLPLELKDIKVEQILPPNCLKAKSVSEFMKELEKSDTIFEARRKKADLKNMQLRFIAKLENGKATVSLLEVDTNHPFYHLSGSDNIISFKTDRYKDRPLVVKGPGAGAEVTAAGVFAQIISIGNYFEGGN